MLRRIIRRLVIKHGFIGLLLFIGDIAVQFTPSKKDDKKWEEIKELLDSLV
jgi:hypothetical protein